MGAVEQCVPNHTRDFCSLIHSMNTLSVITVVAMLNSPGMTDSSGPKLPLDSQGCCGCRQRLLSVDGRAGELRLGCRCW